MKGLCIILFYEVSATTKEHSYYKLGPETFKPAQT
jgi:hypothetical protein